MEAKIGKMVQLKNGGPIMTVTALYKDMQGRSQAVCTWFDAQQSEKKGTFLVDALMPYDGEHRSA